MNLIARLSSIAHQRRGSDYRDLKGWVAQPLIDHPLQTNGYDCGLWVLAAIVAVLRGAHRPGMREEDMVAFRHYVHTLVVRVPTA
jgi:Ulp1 family protease